MEKLEENRICDASDLEHVIDKVTIETAINLLPEELREVIILYYFQELKLSEIASVLQVSLSLVKYRVKQAKKQLEQFLRKEGYDGYTKNDERL